MTKDKPLIERFQELADFGANIPRNKFNKFVSEVYVKEAVEKLKEHLEDGGYGDTDYLFKKIFGEFK